MCQPEEKAPHERDGVVHEAAAMNAIRKGLPRWKLTDSQTWRILMILAGQGLCF